MSNLVFTSEPKTRTVPDLPFTLDGRDYTAHAPKTMAWGVLFTATAGGHSREGFAAITTFLDACLDIEDQLVLEARLRDQSDDLDLPDLLEVVGSLVEEWEPYLGEEFADLTGQNRQQRRAAARRSQTPVRAAAPRRAPAAARPRGDEG